MRSRPTAHVKIDWVGSLSKGVVKSGEDALALIAAEGGLPRKREASETKRSDRE